MLSIGNQSLTLIPQIQTNYVSERNAKRLLRNMCEMINSWVMNNNEGIHPLCCRCKYNNNVDMTTQVAPMIIPTEYLTPMFKAKGSVCTECGYTRTVELIGLDCRLFQQIRSETYTYKYVKAYSTNLYHRSIIIFPRSLQQFRLIFRKIEDEVEFMLEIYMVCMCTVCMKSSPELTYKYNIRSKVLNDEEVNQATEDIGNYVLELLEKQTSPIEGIYKLDAKPIKEISGCIYVHQVLHDLLNLTLINKPILGGKRHIVSTDKDNWYTEEFTQIIHARIV